MKITTTHRVSLAWLIALAGCAEPPPPSPTPEVAPAHRFEDACQQLSGVARADAAAAAEGVASIAYELERDGQHISLEARAPDESALGELDIALDATAGLTPLATASATYQEGDVIARQVTTATRVGTVIRLTNVREIDGVRAFVWRSLDESGAVIDATAGALTSAEPDANAGIVRTLEGTFATLPIIRDGEQVLTEEAQRAFVAAHGLEVFEDHAVARRLEVIVNDPGWQGKAGASILSCDASAAAAREGEIGLTSNQVSQPLECDKGVDFFELTVQLHAAFSITTNVLEHWPKIVAGVAAGAIGGSAGGVIVTLLIASFVADRIANHVVKNRGADIIAAPAALAGDERSAAAVREFYGKKGSSTGDPHLTTHDGESFDLQVAGEIVLVRGLVSAFELQARQGSRPASTCPDVSYNDAIALRLGSHRVSYDLFRERRLYVDGVDVDLLDGALLLDDGGRIFQDGDRLRFDAPTGETVVVTGAHNFAVFVHLPPSLAGAYEGALGNFDGEPDNDFVDGDGQVLPTPVPWETLHGAFADAWRVDAEDTLFDYLPGEGPETFHLVGVPTGPATLASLDPTARAAAEVTCASVTNPTAFDDCVLDVACTSAAAHEELVTLHEMRDPRHRAEIVLPLTFDGWTQEGPAANGNWVVSADKKSVLQTLNGEPTFFVSPGDHLGVRIDGTIKTGPADDDPVGFVFGYQSPIAANGDADTVIDAFVLTWKKAAQDVHPEGLRLLHVHGDLAADGANPLFWDLTATDKVELLAEDVGAGTGWRTRPSRFSLLYTAERVEIWIDGELRIALDAVDSPRPFVAGRFGFFNFSQPNTSYADFTVGPPSPSPTRAACTMVFDHAEASWINEDTTFGSGCTRYVITAARDLLVEQGTLTILPGTRVLFEAGNTFEVRDGAALIAEGTAEEPIHIGGTEAVVGHWGGLSINSSSPLNSLRHVVLSDTGATGWQFNNWGLTVTGSSTVEASVAIEDSVFLRHGGHALHIIAGADLRSFARNRFDENEDLSVFIPYSLLHKLDPASSFAGAQNALPSVGVTPTASVTAPISGQVTWRKLDVPYRFLPGDHRIFGADTVVTIEPGTRLELDGAGLDMHEGALTAIGTAEEPIVFTGASQTPGSWRGLYFQQMHDENVLEHVEVRYAGADGFQFSNTALMVTGTSTTAAKLTLKNSVVSDTAGSAVQVRAGAVFVEENNSYTNNSGGDVVTP